MAIRITGMYSGLDTESIISELASAQSVKKNKLVKHRHLGRRAEQRADFEDRAVGEAGVSDRRQACSD